MIKHYFKFGKSAWDISKNIFTFIKAVWNISSALSKPTILNRTMYTLLNFKAAIRLGIMIKEDVRIEIELQPDTWNWKQNTPLKSEVGAEKYRTYVAVNEAMDEVINYCDASYGDLGYAEFMKLVKVEENAFRDFLIAWRGLDSELVGKLSHRDLVKNLGRSDNDE